MKLTEWLLPALFGVAMAAVLGFYARSLVRGARVRWARYRRIVDTERTRIGQLRTGLFEVRGRVLPPEQPLTSPLRKAACVYFKFVVKEKRTHSVRRNGRTHTKSVWATVVTDERATEFSISDGSGQVRVPLLPAEKHFKRDTTRSSGFLNGAPEELKTMLRARYGRETEGFLFNKAMQFEETVIAERDELYVLGEVARGPAGFTFTEGSNARADQLLLVTDRGEDHVRQDALWRCIGVATSAAFVGALVLAVLGGVGWLVQLGLTT